MNNDIQCYACNEFGHIARNCPLVQRNSNGWQRNNGNTRNVHFQQEADTIEGDQQPDGENEEGNIFSATQLFQSQGQCHCDSIFHIKNGKSDLRDKLFQD